jgi:protein ImuA
VSPLEAPEIDAALPWGGLPRAALHEVIGEDGAASGFCAAVLARFAGERGAVLWCRRKRGLYGPGLAGLGLDTGRLIVVRGRTTTDVLWAMEEGLRGGGLAAVMGEVDGAGPIALRRLQLAAEANGVAALLLRSGHGKGVASPAVTRWRVAAVREISAKARREARLPFAETAAVCWRVELLNCRNVSGLTKAVGPSPGLPRTWLVEWRDGATGGFRVAADLRDRPPAAAAKPEARLAV